MHHIGLFKWLEEAITEYQSQDIETFLNKKIGTKKVVTDYVIDSGTHLNNKAHKMVVDYLLSNENFKKELEWMQE